jgi:hypothetical protein
MKVVLSKSLSHPWAPFAKVVEEMAGLPRAYTLHIGEAGMWVETDAGERISPPIPFGADLSVHRKIELLHWLNNTFFETSRDGWQPLRNPTGQ